jgi:hypothetical protein
MPPLGFALPLSNDQDELAPFIDLTESQIGSLSPEGKSCIRPRNIRFSDYLEVSVHHHLVDDYSERERNAMWYDGSDVKSFRRQRQQLANLLKAGRSIHDDCIEGLETRKSSESIVDAVMNEQESQERKGICDPETLSRVYKMCSGSSAEEALDRGLQLQQDVLSSRWIILPIWTISDDQASWWKKRSPIGESVLIKKPTPNDARPNVVLPLPNKQFHLSTRLALYLML